MIFLKDYLIKFSISFFAGLLVAFLFWLLGWLRKKLSLPPLSRLYPRMAKLISYLLILIWIFFNFIAFWLIYKYSLPWYLNHLFFIASSGPVLYFLRRELSTLWQVGIRGADKHIYRGINYEDALKFCQNEFAFLGIGASKLTRSEGFEGAMLRCRNEGIRFLLCKPTYPHLDFAARQAGKDRMEYKRIVVSSLRKISQIKESRALVPKSWTM